MNRYKFRGKSLKTGEWAYGFYQEYDGRAYIKSINAGTRFGCGAEVDPNTVGQYVGLPDKNAKEIYEGDVLRHPGKAVSGAVPAPGVVEYKDGRFQADFRISPNMTRNCHLTSQMEIIGNIHDSFEAIAESREKGERRRWLEGLRVDPDPLNLDIDCAYCPCGERVQIFPRTDDTLVEKFIDEHFGHSGK